MLTLLQRIPLVIRIVLLAAIYCAAAKLGLAVAYVNASATAVWPPTGIALAALLLFGHSMWPGVTLGAFAANFATSGALMAAGIATGNTLEAVIAAGLIRGFAGGVDALRRTPGLFLFLFFAAFASTVSATVGVGTLVSGGAVAREIASKVWLTWWLGDLLGAIVYTPFVVYWVLPSDERWTVTRLAEFAIVFGTALIVALLVFGGAISFAAIRPVGTFSFPIVVWAALRFSQREAVTSAFAFSAIAVWGTIHGHGPYAGTAPNQALLLVQAFAGILTMTGCEVAALATEHRRLRRDLERRVADRTEQLETMQMRLLEAQGVAHIGSWEWDIERNAVWWSDEMCRLYSVNPAGSRSYEDFLNHVHPDDRERVRAIVARAFEDGQPFAFEHRIVRPDRSIITLAASGRVVVDEHGKARRMLGTGQDITERKRADAEREALAREQEARREAEELSRLKDEFLAMMSHELRTPLNAVLGWAHLLTTTPHDPERTAKGLRVIQRNAQLQTRLIEDLLDVSEFIAGRTRLDRRSINLTPIVASAADAVGVAAAKKQIKIHVSSPDQILVDGDGHRLQQVITNLLGNAVKFTPDEGRVDIAIEGEERGVVVRVADTGRGIDPVLLPHVFDPFWQGDVRRHAGGLGLGLTIVRLIVEAHNGSVRAESAGLGKGATFIVTLPRPGVTESDAVAGR